MQHKLAGMDLRDIVRLVERQPSRRGAELVRLLPAPRAAVLFDALAPAHQAEIVEALGDHQIPGLFDALGTEDLVMLLDHMDPEVAERVLNELDEDDRAYTDLILAYEKGSVGRVMSPNVEAVGATETAQEVVDKLRAHVDDLETIYTVPVIDDMHHVTGVLSLKDLFKARADDEVGTIMRETPTVVESEDAEYAARRLLASGHLAYPVVDNGQHLVGIFTYDEAQDIVEFADSEDSARQGGSESLKQPYLSTPVLNLVRSRIVWLLVLAVSAILTVQVLGIFEDTLAQVTVLSLFIPLLTGTGGNTGNQAATTVTRAIALGDIKIGDGLRVISRETRVGALLGTLIGTIGFAITSIFYGSQIGAVIGLTLLSICTLAATVGGAMPLVARKFGIDPAVFANPFISTLLDASGLVIYFLIAKAVIGI